MPHGTLTLEAAVGLFVRDKVMLCYRTTVQLSAQVQMNFDFEVWGSDVDADHVCDRERKHFFFFYKYYIILLESEIRWCISAGKKSRFSEDTDQVYTSEQIPSVQLDPIRHFRKQTSTTEKTIATNQITAVSPSHTVKWL